MKLTKLLSILSSALLFSACSVNDDLEYMAIETDGLTRSTYIGQLKYPLYSFIDTVDVDKNDIGKLNESLSLMQTIEDDGYIPLFKVLLKSHIFKIYRHAFLGPSQAAYNPYTNSVIIRTGAVITENVLPEELIHAGQDRIYPKGIAQYSGRMGTPNIEFEAKLTQDLISYISGLPFGLGVGENNDDEYSQWLIKLCGDISNPTFPCMDSVLTVKQDGSGYYEMMRDFKIKAYQYNYEIIDTLKPLYINYTSKNYGK